MEKCLIVYCCSPGTYPTSLPGYKLCHRHRYFFNPGYPARLDCAYPGCWEWVDPRTVYCWKHNLCCVCGANTQWSFQLCYDHACQGWKGVTCRSREYEHSTAIAAYAEKCARAQGASPANAMILRP
jgi:hypothetical protein